VSGLALPANLVDSVLTDRTLADSALRSKYGVTVVSIKRRGEDFSFATADTTVYAGDILIVAGKTGQVEGFTNLS
jgi:trk system potassium uptake protein TrkA